MKGDWVYVIKTHAGGMWGVEEILRDEERMKLKRQVYLDKGYTVIVEVWNVNTGIRIGRWNSQGKRKEMGNGEN
jgi:hypothetical protein